MLQHLGTKTIILISVQASNQDFYNSETCTNMEVLLACLQIVTIYACLSSGIIFLLST